MKKYKFLVSFIGITEKNIYDVLNSNHPCTLCYLSQNNIHKLKKYSLKASSKFPHISQQFVAITNNSNLNDLFIFECKHHGKFYKTFETLLRTKTGCTQCAYTTSTSSYVDTLQKLPKSVQVSFEKFVFNGYLIHSTFICKVHDYEYTQTPKQYAVNNGCSKCSFSSVSKEEMDVLEYIKSFYSGVILSSYRPKWLKGKEIDIFIPEFNLGIEYNGTIYHHSTSGVNSFFDATYKQPTYHYNKWNICKNNNIQLLTIFDFKWLCSKDYYQNLLKHYISIKTIVNSSDCTMVVISSDVAVKFYLNFSESPFNLLSNQIYYGIYYNSELIACILCDPVNLVLHSYTFKYGYEILKLFTLFKTSGCNFYTYKNNTCTLFNNKNYITKLEYYWVHKNGKQLYIYNDLSNNDLILSGYLQVYTSGETIIKL